MSVFVEITSIPQYNGRTDSTMAITVLSTADKW